jgi:hypothetical protein
MEGGSGDMGSSYGELQGKSLANSGSLRLFLHCSANSRIVLLKTYGLPNNPVNIDEYSTYPEQVPSGSAWWIAQYVSSLRTRRLNKLTLFQARTD